MKTITVISEDRIGLLADISYILSKSKINIEGVTVDVCSTKAIIAITVKHPEKAVKVLNENGYSANSSDTLVVKHPRCDNCMQEIAALLSGQRIDIENVNMVSDDKASCIFTMNVNRPRKAVKILGDLLINRPA